MARRLEELGLPHDETLSQQLPPRDSAEWDVAADTLLDRSGRTATTGLLVHSDPDAVGLVQRCEARGIAVPQDLSLVAYDDEVASLFRPALTAVRPPRGSIGRAAVGLLAERLADPGRPVHRVLVSPALEVRESTAAPRR